jgi:hypothetical protein
VTRGGGGGGSGAPHAHTLSVGDRAWGGRMRALLQQAALRRGALALATECLTKRRTGGGEGTQERCALAQAGRQAGGCPRKLTEAAV